jgi:cathepsin L
MRFELFFLALAISSSFALHIDITLQWAKFKKEHNKQYESSLHDLTRFKIFESNWNYIDAHNREANAGKHTFWLEMNKFGDLTAPEFAKMYNGFNATRRVSSVRTHQVFSDAKSNAPDSIDWRTKGYVTDVKDQGQCGSCWAFSTTGSLEGQHFKQTGKLVSLSEQNLVDCSQKYGNMGCNGGLMDQAFQYIKDNKGIDTEESYPYKAVDQQCKFDAANVGATDNGFTDVKSKDEKALEDAVGTVGPVSVAIDASHASFQFYKVGIYHELLCSQTRLDHGVLAVGYDKQGKEEYWIVKNSWGTGWGDKGYIKMSKDRKNNCGIATAASYPMF